jgi:hypothetical protein
MVFHVAYDELITRVIAHCRDASAIAVIQLLPAQFFR